MAQLIDICADLMRGVVDLLVIISGPSHGVLQGTHEAVLAEAQGAQIGPRGFNHLNSLRQTGIDITAREEALNQAINSLGSVHPNLGNRVRAILDPLLRQSSAYRAAIGQTESMAESLAQTDGRRLSGVIFGQGGTGPDVVRSAKALVSTQMNERAKELTARGIEPRLIPAARQGAASVMSTIRQLPITIRDATDKIIGIIGAIRLLLVQAARQALIVGNAALSAALESLEAALVRAGSRFTTPVIFINIRRIMKDLGLEHSPDDA
jgi:hypothetical protein